MKERPIIFSAPMVRAILSGAKTQTRRVMKVRCHSICEGDDGKLWPWSEDAELAEDFWHPCPFGKPGDRLWVRETCRAEAIGDEGLCGVRYVADGQFMPIANTREASDRWVQLYWYRGMEGATVPPIHMPRWASRITLEITDVRVERLQDISEADAVAEGVRRGDGKWHALGDGEAVFLDEFGWFAPERYTRHNAPRHAFREAWEIINGPESWAANPWVWVIEFKRLESGDVR